MNFSLLQPCSATDRSSNLVIEPLQINITGTPYQSEAEDCKQIEEQIKILESTQELLPEQLAKVECNINKLIFSLEEKEEFQLRLRWIQRLYKTAQTAKYPQTQKLQSIGKYKYMPEYPLKKFVLSTLVTTYAGNKESSDKVTPSLFDSVLNRAIAQAGEEFVNLGGEGREHIIRHSIKNYGDELNFESIHKAVTELEKRVIELASIDDTLELQLQLETLPLGSYLMLSSMQKKQVAEQLKMNMRWDGLAQLDRFVRQVIAKLRLEEKTKAIEAMTEQSVNVLDIEYLESDAIRFDSH